MDNLDNLIREGKATIIDVRSPAEFMGGHVAGSRNIPLQEIPGKLEELKAFRNIVFCCASGSRSGQAAAYLKAHGIPCANGGSWLKVNALI